MNLRDFFFYVRKNIEELRKFKNPDKRTVLIIREEMANMGIEVTPDEVEDYMKLIGATIDRIDKLKGKD